MRTRDENRSLFGRLAVTFALILMVAPIAACAGGGDDATGGEGAAGATANAADAADTAEHAEGGEHGEAGAADEEHVHPAGDDVPSRADEEARDEYSKPLEVYALTEIEAGDTVVDVGASSGYNAYLLADVVGEAGTVYAVRGNEGLMARLEAGDMADVDNVELVGSTSEVPDGVADAVLLIREYHLAPDRGAVLAEVMRMLEPGGTVAVVEVRLGPDQREGYDHDSHRSGEDTVIGEFVDGGFELVTESDLLYLEGDDYSAYGGATGTRYVTDRMLLIFRKP